VSYATTGDSSLVGSGGRSTIVLLYPPKNGDPTQVLGAMSAAAKTALPGLTVHETGIDALTQGNTAGGGSSSVLTELLIGVLAALVILAWVFGSVLAVIPLMAALVSVLAMQLAIYGLTFVFPSSTQPFNPAVQYIVALLGLGLSIDYSLLIVTRWREERARGLDNDAAVRRAVRKAGHAVAFSGLTASLGLVALVLVPVSLVRGIGISGLFIPSIATLVALTLIPVVLSKAGQRLDWPRRRRAGNASRFWSWWAHGVIRHRIAATVVGLAVLLGLGGTALSLNIGQPTASSLASSGPYYQGLQTMRTDGFPSGVLTTIPVWVPSGVSQQATAASLARLPSVHGAVPLTGPSWHASDGSMVMVLPAHETATAQAGTSLSDVRLTVPSQAMVGGDAVLSVDETSVTYGAFPLMFAVVALVTFVLLARGMRSLLLPIKAVLLNALSVAATYGILVLVWQHGVGTQALWGASATGTIDTWVPLLLFGFLFGISMDYEVFIIARMRESYDRTGSTSQAIVEGVGRTGRLVTSAALILFFALASLSTGNDPTVRQLGSGMAAGVLLDATVVRMLLLPALVSLFGRANWWMPKPLARLLRIPPDDTASPEEHEALPKVSV
jgi:RND superfamily putative drug exporter